MAFGNHYAHYELPEYEQLENGDYYVQIIGVEDKQYPQSKDFYRDVKIRFKSRQNVNPNTITLNDTPILNAPKGNGTYITQKDIDNANGRLTRFFQAFNIPEGNFNLQTWIGKAGWVHCAEQYDPKEPDKKSKKYKQLTPIIKKETTTEAVPPQVQQIAKAVEGTAAQGNIFPDF